MIGELEKWYLSQCNEEWEHAYGIEIGTLDNPGWFLKVDLHTTYLETKGYQPCSYGIRDGGEPNGNNWLVTKVEERKFIGYGGPKKLGELINTFLTWAQENA